METTLARDLTTVAPVERLAGAARLRRLIDATFEAHFENPTIRARSLPCREAAERREAPGGRCAASSGRAAAAPAAARRGRCAKRIGARALARPSNRPRRATSSTPFSGTATARRAAPRCRASSAR